MARNPAIRLYADPVKRAAHSLVLYDDARARTFEPFALSRPMSEMRVGASLMRERWEFALESDVVAFASAPHLAQFSEPGAPRHAQSMIPKGHVLVNSRAAIALERAPRTTDASPNGARSWFVNGRLAAFELAHDLPLEALANVPALEALAGHSLDADERVDVRGVWIDEVWDIVGHLVTLLGADIPALAYHWSCTVQPAIANGPVVVGEHDVYLEAGATIEPFTYFDTSAGPVLVRSGSTVQAFTRVIGPCFIGRDCVVTTDRIAASSIGDTCRVHGELSTTVFIGQSNKGHDGFVGHSIVGRWVNMGAGTITSNLKNTYGTVALWTPGGTRDTGLQFLGTLFGDHVKTGIGLQLTTGCVLGMAANVFSTMPPKAVDPFAWGSRAPYDSYDVDKFLETVARMMARRHVELSADARACLVAAHAARWRVERSASAARGDA